MIPHQKPLFNPQVVEKVARLCFLTCLIDFTYFDRGLSLAIDRRTILLEAHR